MSTNTHSHTADINKIKVCQQPGRELDEVVLFKEVNAGTDQKHMELKTGTTSPIIITCSAFL